MVLPTSNFLVAQSYHVILLALRPFNSTKFDAAIILSLAGTLALVTTIFSNYST